MLIKPQMSCSGLRKGRFWITPDPYHNDDNIQIGREVKISCQVEATPPEELQFIWLKNGRPLRSSERMVITHTDANVSPGTTNLDIIDLKFTDFGTYTCVASLANGGSPEISIDVNISSTTGESGSWRGRIIWHHLGYSAVSSSGLCLQFLQS